MCLVRLKKSTCPLFPPPPCVYSCPLFSCCSLHPPPPFPARTLLLGFQEYIHHLIFERLGDGSIVEVLKKLMRLHWSEAEPYLLKCLLKVR